VKNRFDRILLALTGVFLGFVLGFLLGRSTTRGDVMISLPIESSEPDRSAPLSVQAAAPTVASMPSMAEETQALSLPQSPEDTVPQEREDSPGLININTATREQLESLPGIGPVLAQRIIDYREQHGPFQAVGQLTMVEGIGSKRLAALLSLITTEQEE